MKAAVRDDTEGPAELSNTTSKLLFVLQRLAPENRRKELKTRE
jgi:hypothetical protein